MENLNQLLQNTGFLVLGVNLLTELLKWAVEFAYKNRPIEEIPTPTKLTQLACVLIVGFYALCTIIFGEDKTGVVLTQLVIVYVFSTKVYDVVRNQAKK